MNHPKTMPLLPVFKCCCCGKESDILVLACRLCGSKVCRTCGEAHIQVHKDPKNMFKEVLTLNTLRILSEKIQESIDRD